MRHYTIFDAISPFRLIIIPKMYLVQKNIPLLVTYSLISGGQVVHFIDIFYGVIGNLLTICSDLYTKSGRGLSKRIVWGTRITILFYLPN